MKHNTIYVLYVLYIKFALTNGVGINNVLILHLCTFVGRLSNSNNNWVQQMEFKLIP